MLYSCKEFSDNAKIELEGFWAIYSAEKRYFGNNTVYFSKDKVCRNLSLKKSSKITNLAYHYNNIPDLEFCRCKNEMGSWIIDSDKLSIEYEQSTKSISIYDGPRPQSLSFQIYKINEDELNIVDERGELLVLFRISKYQAIERTKGE